MSRRLGRARDVVVLIALAVVYALSLVALWRALGFWSPWVGLFIMLAVLGLVAFARPLFLLRMPRSLRTVRPWELSVYGAIGVPWFGVLLRRTPLRFLNTKVYLSRLHDPSRVIAQAECAEAAHLYAGAAFVPHIAHACMRGSWGALVWMIAVQIGFNLYRCCTYAGRASASNVCARDSVSEESACNIVGMVGHAWGRSVLCLLVAACSSHESPGDAGDAGDAQTSDVANDDDASSPSGFPGPQSTGVPPGTTLSDYAGPCLITTDGTVIDSKHVTCDLEIHAANVVIQKSLVEGLVFLDADLPGANAWSFTLQDSEVDGGSVQRAAVSDGNMVVLRSNVHGGETAVHCSENAISCKVQDSWLHGQYLPDDQPWHLGGFQSNGGTNIVIVHNNIVCDHAQNSLGEGCTGDLNLIPDFAVVSNVTIDHNYFGANIDASYCTYGGEKSTSPFPHADHVVYTNNVFQRGTNQMCGSYGPVTGFDVTGTGNQWTNNTWEDDGTPVPPAN